MQSSCCQFSVLYFFSSSNTTPSAGFLSIAPTMRSGMRGLHLLMKQIMHRLHPLSSWIWLHQQSEQQRPLPTAKPMQPTAFLHRNALLLPQHGGQSAYPVLLYGHIFPLQPGQFCCGRCLLSKLDEPNVPLPADCMALMSRPSACKLESVPVRLPDIAGYNDSPSPEKVSSCCHELPAGLYCKIYNFAIPAMNCRWWLCHQEPPFILSSQSQWLCSRF